MVVDRIKVVNQLSLKQGVYPGLSGWDQYNYMVPYMQKRDTGYRVRGDVMKASGFKRKYITDLKMEKVKECEYTLQQLYTCGTYFLLEHPEGTEIC